MESGRLFFDPSACQSNLFFRGARTMMSMEEPSEMRRPFFSSPEDLFDEDYYDEQSPEKKRRLTPEQVHLLEKSFEAGNKLEPERKTQLAKKLGLQPRQVAVWFQNRRARWKTKQLERDFDLLKASLDSLCSNYDSVLKENEKLKSEVASLTNKLQAKEEVSGQKADLFPIDPAGVVAALQADALKVEDRLSTGSGGSAVVDGADGRQHVDSGDSYYPNDDYPAIQSDEAGDGSEDGRNYFSDLFVPTQQEEQQEEPLGWWVWS